MANLISKLNLKNVEYSIVDKITPEQIMALPFKPSHSYIKGDFFISSKVGEPDYLYEVIEDFTSATIPTEGKVKTVLIADKIKEIFAEIKKIIAQPMKFIGITTTELSDNSTVNPIIINKESTKAVRGDLAIYNSLEFIFDGTKWHELGSTGKLGNLAYADTASTSYTPEGSVTGKISTTAGVGTCTVTPKGNISKPTFKGTPGTIPITVPTVSSIGIAAPAEGSKGNYTPQGTISKPGINYNLSTGTVVTEVSGIKGANLCKNFSATVLNETLSIGYDSVTPDVTKGTSTVSGTVGLAAAPTFSGTDVQISPVSENKQYSGSYTPVGEVSKPTFTGTSSTGTTTGGAVNANITEGQLNGTPTTITVTPDSKV